jgi:hypothetical protein
MAEELRVKAISVIGLVLALARTAAATTPVEVARGEAESNAKSPAGKRYEGVLVSKAEEWLRPALERCVKDAPETERISFDALVQVSSEGRAEEVLFGPQTEIAKCVAPDFRDARYPSPPQPSWWVKIVVRLK